MCSDTDRSSAVPAMEPAHGARSSPMGWARRQSRGSPSHATYPHITARTRGARVW